jgi:hypothetical protein
MILILLIIILLLVFYVGYVAEQARIKADSAVMLLAKQVKEESKHKATGLDYEWGQQEWPKWSEDAPADRAWVPYKNPPPYTSQDAYAVALLKAEAGASADAHETKRFLDRAYQTLGAYLPKVLCDAVVSNPDSLVRAWAASHINLIHKDYSLIDRSSAESLKEGFENAPIVRDYRSMLKLIPTQ